MHYLFISTFHSYICCMHVGNFVFNHLVEPTGATDASPEIASPVVPVSGHQAAQVVERFFPR